VICLDCGFRGKTLRRHISKQHGLSRDEYRQRWGLRSDHPLTAPAYSEQRSTLAKEVGLGRKPKAQVADAAKPVVAAAPVDAGAETQTAPSLRRRSRSKQADVVSQAVAAQPPSRRRRTRSRPASPITRSNFLGNRELTASNAFNAHCPDTEFARKYAQKQRG